MHICQFIFIIIVKGEVMIICVCGPTGIGKTRLSETLAEKFDAIVLNADATQIYKELDIGSAKITKEEMGEREHFLFDIVSPNEDYSVSDYQNDARNILNKYEGKNIVIVGGTGLYIKALLYDYKFEKIHKNNYDNLTNDELFALANKKDPNHNLHKNNRVRLINFLNREKTETNKDASVYDAIFIGLSCDRDALYDRCNKRVDIMLENGLLNEVKTLYEKYPESNILKRAIGYKEIIKYLNNEITFEEALELIKKNTRHYVKRQYTWFNNQLPVNWFNTNFDDFSQTENEVINFIQTKNKE